ncbi:hypothetical protein SCHPADRAFT_830503 [Schizopora paradoxa]|uniref:Wax synthase domain-containing protein n=1 Tax=Schizopora paradoxa TaxID=27342 RepID=A0A0H2RJI3_9AGAM|nr:hypothetical protein SCHPADRAFT_830503 [Schizopora paradoxa]
MAYLVRRPNTWIMRVLLLPIVLVMAICSCYGYVWTDPRLNVYNWGEGLYCLLCIAKAIEFASVRGGRRKIGETLPGDDERPAISKKDYDPTGHSADSNGHVPVTGLERPGSRFLPVWLEDAIEVLCSLRGIGWDFGKGTYIPRETKPIERNAFIRATFSSFFRSLLILDFVEACIKLVPGLGTPAGGTMFLPWLPPLQRYALSTAIHFASGFALLTGFRMCYDLCTLIAVTALGHEPTSWPPPFENPWISTSLTEFWAKRWHQFLRQTFVVFGGHPGMWLGGRVGMVLGTFLASGLYHECAMVAMGREWDNTVPFFFALQGVCILLERAWKKLTGKRVGGWPGTLWVYFVIIVVGQPCVDSWHRRGLGGGFVIPPFISPTRLLIFPMILRILQLVK